ncbi:substrate-binding domain-containing protein [Sabulicella rubraurantiaca]|uniref:substrate-binding domain-containing protein n=1 Tax=Sabulicella rubraurantiaca TaxID=2811429 RepID=UPI001A95D36D|nr:substrate-binding domain-containing protein [Sabulicella rubraurantiaca]
MLRRFVLLAALVLAAPALRAAEITVMTSGGFNAAYEALAPVFERETGHRLVTLRGASMGAAPDAIPNRLARGEAADVLILAAEALDALAQRGFVRPGSRTDLVVSRIGASVRAGGPRWDISTEEGLRRALLEAPSIAYSASASGEYLSRELFARLGLAELVMPKARRIYSERVGSVVARGEAALGFQQISELLPIAGLDFLGPLPESLQRVTVFSAGIAANAREEEAARALIEFLAGPRAYEAARALGLDPIAR